MRLQPRGISFLTRENLNYLLEDGKTVLGVWNAPNCVKCGTDFWDVHYLLYAYRAEEEDVRVFLGHHG